VATRVSMPVCFVKVPAKYESQNIKYTTNQTNKERIDECVVLQSSNINNSHYNLSKNNSTSIIVESKKKQIIVTYKYIGLLLSKSISK
jgi:hypothetical protein